MIRRLVAPAAGALAVAAGWTARQLVRYGVGVAGGICLTVGAYQLAPPAGWAVAGGLLLALDRKVP